jgi:arginase family enzyme
MKRKLSLIKGTVFLAFVTGVSATITVFVNGSDVVTAIGVGTTAYAGYSTYKAYTMLTKLIK